MFRLFSGERPRSLTLPKPHKASMLASLGCWAVEIAHEFVRARVLSNHHAGFRCLGERVDGNNFAWRQNLPWDVRTENSEIFWIRAHFVESTCNPPEQPAMLFPVRDVLLTRQIWNDFVNRSEEQQTKLLNGMSWEEDDDVQEEADEDDWERVPRGETLEDKDADDKREGSSCPSVAFWCVHKFCFARTTCAIFSLVCSSSKLQC